MSKHTTGTTYTNNGRTKVFTDRMVELLGAEKLEAQGWTRVVSKPKDLQDELKSEEAKPKTEEQPKRNYKKRGA